MTDERPLPPPPWPRPLPGWSRGPSVSVVGLTLLASAVAAWTAGMLDAGPATWWTLAAVLAVWMALAAPGGVFARVARQRVERRRRANPDAPWLGDHAWDPRGAEVGPLAHLRRTRPLPLAAGLVGALTAAMSAALAHWRWWSVAAFGALATTWAWRLWTETRYGTARLTFAKFPFHPGERVTLYFGMSEGGATFHRVAFQLRRVVESGAFLRRRAAVPLASTHERPPGLLPGPGADVEATFDLPSDLGGTSLSAPLPAYWELCVVGETSAGPYAESFLVPIYDRPASEATP